MPDQDPAAVYNGLPANDPFNTPVKRINLVRRIADPGSIERDARVRNVVNRSVRRAVDFGTRQEIQQKPKRILLPEGAGNAVVTAVQQANGAIAVFDALPHPWIPNTTWGQAKSELINWYHEVARVELDEDIESCDILNDNVGGARLAQTFQNQKCGLAAVLVYGFAFGFKYNQKTSNTNLHNKLAGGSPATQERIYCFCLPMAMHICRYMQPVNRHSFTLDKLLSVNIYGWRYSVSLKLQEFGVWSQTEVTRRKLLPPNDPLYIGGTNVQEKRRARGVPLEFARVHALLCHNWRDATGLRNKRSRTLDHLTRRELDTLSDAEAQSIGQNISGLVRNKWNSAY